MAIEGEIVDKNRETASSVTDGEHMPTPTEIEISQADSEMKAVGVVFAAAKFLMEKEIFGRFRGRCMMMVDKPFPHYMPLHKSTFDLIGYQNLGGVTRSRLSDVFALVTNIAPDLTDQGNMMLFGLDMRHVEVEADTDIASLAFNKPRVWDMDSLTWIHAYPKDSSKYIWRSPYSAVEPHAEEPVPIPFIMSLAGGSQGLYDDIMQSMAPLMMAKKPDGVVWWVGDGANGKSTLMDALYRIFPDQLSSLTVKALTDGRDTPYLNGNLANIVKESSEGRIEDTEIYKAIGTHENFRVHKFHSQESIEINGNMHHIFSANSIPTFNDKGFSARRRTFIVPFTQTFESDPNFEHNTFTAEMFGQLISEMARYAVRLRKQQYRYKWSAVTLAAKADYDTAANNAEEYAREIIQQGVVAFDGYNPLRMDYENWCGDNGYTPLGILNLRRAISASGFERVSHYTPQQTRKLYRLPFAEPPVLMPMGLGRPGLYTTEGFRPEPTPAEKADVPQFTAAPEPEPVEEVETTTTTTTKPSILQKRW